MSLESDLREWFLSDSAITSRLGQRLFFSAAPTDAAYPHAVYDLESEFRPRDLAGDFGPAEKRIEIEIKSLDPVELVAIATAIDDKVEGFNRSGETSIGATRVDDLVVENTSDQEAQPPPGSGARPLYSRILDLVLWTNKT